MIVKSLLQICSSTWFTLPWWMITVLFDHRLPALPFIAVRSEITAHHLVNRYFESRLARGRLDKRDCQVAAYILLRLWLLRCFQGFDKFSGLGGRLEA